MTTRVERLEVDGEPVRRITLVAVIDFADREAGSRDEYDHNYYADSELEDVATGWMADGLEDRDDSPRVTFREVPGDDSVDDPA